MSLQIDDVGQLAVVLSDDYLRADLKAFNQESLANKRPWLLVKPVGSQIWIGPLFLPGQTGCWECLAHRLRANRPIESYLQERKGYKVPPLVPSGSSSLSMQTASNLVAMAVSDWVVNGELPRLEGTLVSIDLFSFVTETHTVIRLPQCPSCGDFTPKRSTVKPIYLSPCKKTFTSDGGHRSLPPAETLKRFLHHVSPITGVVKLLAPVPARTS